LFCGESRVRRRCHLPGYSSRELFKPGSGNGRRQARAVGLAPPCRALHCPAEPRHARPRRAPPCPALPDRAKPCLACGAYPMSGPRGHQRAPWDRWYNLECWRKRSRRQRREQPLCAMCLALGRVVPATVADHLVPHRGDWNAFLTGTLQSVCFSCHNSKKFTDEARGYGRTVGADGWPLDPKHPANLPHQWRTSRAARAAHKRNAHGGTNRPATSASAPTASPPPRI